MRKAWHTMSMDDKELDALRRSVEHIDVKAEATIIQDRAWMYDRLRVRRSPLHYSDVLRRIVGKNKTVLDYGCGHGTLGFALGTNCDGIKVDGYDPSPWAITAKYHKKEEISGKYDYVIIGHVLEYEPMESVIDILRFARERAGGVLVAMSSHTHAFDLYGLRRNHPLLYVVERVGYDIDYLLKCGLGAGGFNTWGFKASRADPRDAWTMERWKYEADHLSEEY